ncbi:aldo/keto reductase [Mesorhizobium sp. CU2]|uniref:aldo/keto reductase n=1 Tax=unclassified Mesorhizobium TaxID=325217 RepID=UPI00112A3E50|nr:MULTISPECIES: aldo/keto reductase [unclassified Mesorhizobium]TPN85555.1 aldo/keto reductase [Mesorhizobium sp. CU3]TPO11374.1 aldo/keto reductase [Mesorhizobium sp. CU2]
MQQRRFGRTGWQVSDIGFGSWAIGADWGDVEEKDAIAALNAALDAGVSMIDTADVYGDGRAEKLIAKTLKGRGGARPMVATKAGKRLNPHVASGYNRQNLTSFVERSLRYLEVDVLDLVQLHCPITEVFYQPETFEALEKLVEEGKIRHYGVSVEKVEEGIKALQYPGVVSVQIIYNMFRQRPAELFFDMARQKDVAIIVRVPLASGLLSGKFRADSSFSAKDHRNYNRQGEAFDVGETFAGVNYEEGLQAVEELRPLLPPGATMAQWALRWILMNPAVTVTIPGAKSVRQAEENAAASDLPALSPQLMERIADIYERRIKAAVHQRW